ncbi:MAG: SGNH/GDSL hydrolase family protein [bacterium]|nr:SGNH/GDSL hydrolase family protein [bacterium]MDZ4299946.1 SGNH/GDSL hydrolase family protein [Candidatus Sungbacteria bacterium]
MNTTNICIFGDSIAYGAWDASGGWVDRLRSFLHDRTLASRFQDYFFVYHLGIPGNTTRDILHRLTTEAMAREPHVIMFAVGINDARYRDPAGTPHVPYAVFIENMKKILTEAKRLARNIVVVGLTPVDDARTMPFEDDIFFAQKNIERYDAGLQKCAALAGVHYVPVWSVIDAKKDLEDGLHPNAVGHEKLFAVVQDFLSGHGIV